MKPGEQTRFWCAYKHTAESENVYHRMLCYCNAYVMPLADSQWDAPKTAVPVGDDGDYAWTGWHAEACEQCDTQWEFGGEVVAWMRMPRYEANGPRQPASEKPSP